MSSSPTRSLLLLFTFLYLVALQCNGKRLESPPECKKTECAPYGVVHSDDEFEIRRYKLGLWVSSPTIHESSYLAGFGKGVFLLVDYYRGENDRNVTIEQTFPVKVDIEPGSDIKHNLTYTVYLYVPKKYSHNLPRPVSPSIKPVKLPKLQYVAVRRFLVDDRDELIPEQLDALKKSLQGTPYERAASSNAFTILIVNEDTSLLEIALSFD